MAERCLLPPISSIFKRNRGLIQHGAASRHFVSSHGLPLCRSYAWIFSSEAWQNLHSVRYLERPVFWKGKTSYLFAFSLFPVYIIHRLWFFCFTFTVEAHWNRYISANQSVKRLSEKSVCYTHRGNVSGWIVYFTSCLTLACMMYSGSWRACRQSVWKRSAFYSWMFSRQAGFHSEELMEFPGGRFPDSAIHTAGDWFFFFFISVLLDVSDISYLVFRFLMRFLFLSGPGHRVFILFTIFPVSGSIILHMIWKMWHVSSETAVESRNGYTAFFIALRKTKKEMS